MKCKTFHVHQCKEEVLDWMINWADHLADLETIDDATWTIDSGITSASQGYTDTTSTAWFSGGVAGEHYTSSVLIETNQGRKHKAIIVLTVH